MRNKRKSYPSDILEKTPKESRSQEPDVKPILPQISDILKSPAFEQDLKTVRAQFLTQNLRNPRAELGDRLRSHWITKGREKIYRTLQQSPISEIKNLSIEDLKNAHTWPILCSPTHEGSLLGFACQNGRPQVVEFLLNTTDIKCDIRKFELISAVKSNHPIIINTLFDRGMDVLKSATLQDCFDFLYTALEYGAANSLKIILEKIVLTEDEILARQYVVLMQFLGYFKTLDPLYKCLTRLQLDDILKQLFKIKEFDEFFIKWCSPEYISTLLSGSFPEGEKAESKNNLLHLAAKYRKQQAFIDTLVPLIPEQANIKNKDNHLPIELAVESGNLEALTGLIPVSSSTVKQWENVETKSNMAHLAAKNGHDHILDYFKSNYKNLLNVTVTTTNSDPDTLIVTALRHNQHKVLKWFAKNQPAAYQWKSPKTYNTLWHIAAAQGEKITPQVLYELGRNMPEEGLKELDFYKDTPLEIIPQSGSNFLMHLIAMGKWTGTIYTLIATDTKNKGYTDPGIVAGGKIDLGIHMFLSFYLTLLYSPAWRRHPIFRLPRQWIQEIYAYVPNNPTEEILHLVLSDKNSRTRLLVRAITALYPCKEEIPLSVQARTIERNQALLEEAEEILRLTLKTLSSTARAKISISEEKEKQKIYQNLHHQYGSDPKKWPTKTESRKMAAVELCRSWRQEFIAKKTTASAEEKLKPALVS